MSHENLFIDDLIARIKSDLAEYRGPTQKTTGADDGDFFAFDVVKGVYRPKTPARAPGGAPIPEEKPAVFVVPIMGETKDGLNRVTVQLQARAYSKEQDGYETALGAVVTLRDSLLMEPIVAQRYECDVDSIKWASPPEQPLPVWLYWMEVDFILPTAERNPPTHSYLER